MIHEHIAKIDLFTNIDVIFDHGDQNHSCVWLAKELSSRSNPLRTDEFPTRFSAGVDTQFPSNFDSEAFS